MNEDIIAQAQIEINAPVARVWEALITPELIKQYLFGTEAISEWQVGSPIIYRGVWEGKTYEDKGVIKNIIPLQLLETTYWSIAFGPDIPENYKTVSYKLTATNDVTIVTVTQDNNPSEEAKNHSVANWNMVLTKLKELLER